MLATSLKSLNEANLLAGWFRPHQNTTFTVCSRWPDGTHMFRSFQKVESAEFYANWLKEKGTFAFVV
jgi:hypothetical protein